MRPVSRRTPTVATVSVSIAIIYLRDACLVMFRLVVFRLVMFAMVTFPMEQVRYRKSMVVPTLVSAPVATPVSRKKGLWA
jgi:hypothetical protein